MGREIVNVCCMSVEFQSVAQSLSHGLKELGYAAAITSRGVRKDARNIILGAHLVPDARVIPPSSILFNLEQFGSGSEQITQAYIERLKYFEVWDYSERNIEFLNGIGVDAKLVRIGYSPELAHIDAADDQDIDVLFYGAINERRKAVLDKLQSAGLKVAALVGVYGDELDCYIARSKVVINIHYYPSKIFEVVRVSYLLANKKCVVSEVDGETEIEEEFRRSVHCVAYDQLVSACVDLVGNDIKRRKLEDTGFAMFSNKSQADFLRTALRGWGGGNDVVVDPCDTPLPGKINVGSGKDYKADYLNIDINPMWKPDIVADMSLPSALVQEHGSVRFGPIRLQRNSFERIDAYDVVEHIVDLISFMTNCLDLLMDGGILKIRVPYELSLGAWQDPTHVRAFNENSWLYYTEWYWYLGWQESRFDLVSNKFELSHYGLAMQAENKDVESIVRTPRAVDYMEVALRKRALTEEEKTFSKDRFLKR